MKTKPRNAKDAYQKEIDAADQLRDTGQLDAAVLAYQAIISVAPNVALAHYKLGTAYQRANRLEEAAESFKLAINLRPGYPEANNNLGIIFSKQGNDADAEVCYRNAVAENTDYFEAHLNLGNMFRLGSRRAEALYWYRRAIVLNPTSAKAKERLGALYYDLGLHTEAMVQLREALVLDPKLAAAWINLGRCHNAFQQLDDAQNCARTAIPLDPNQMAPWHNLLFASNWRAGEKTEVFELHKRFGDHLLNTIGIEPRAHFKNRPDPNRRLRVGLVSGDLRRHSVSYFVQGILENVDQNQIEFWAYYNHPQFDYRSGELKSLFTEWRSIDGMNNAEAADLIYSDSIDILIDLSGHTGHSSLYVFAAKPAPVQVSWIGYPNTSGLSTIDYRITDEIADPAGNSEQYYTETLVRLPNTFLCYSPPKEAPDVAQTPCLAAGYVTFGSFNTRVKISDETLALWSQILQQVPNSRLGVKSVSGVSDDHGQNSLLEQMRQSGIDTDRVVLLPPYAAIEDHLAAYHRLDIALDTLPYCGTTTTCEALWMGVPVVTLRGDRHASRVGASLLTSIGLDELIGETPDDYVRIAANLAQDPDRLTRLRASMRQKMSASALLDAATSTRNVERALRQMWINYCDSVQASATPVDEVRPDCLEVKTGAGNFLAVGVDPLSDMTSWVLLEQENWFEDDLHFVQMLCLPTWHALDIGASHGVYSLALAAAGATKIWAFEPATEPRLKFRDSLARNDYYKQIEILQFGLAESSKSVQTTQRGREELVHFMTLDSIANDIVPSGVRIDFVKLDAEGGEVAILRGGFRFFLEQSPLVMFECRHGSGAFDNELVSIFRAMGYGIYRLIPGISALVSVLPEQETSLDEFTLNLYACKSEQAMLLGSRGLLIADLNDREIVPLQQAWSVELFSIPAIAATLPPAVDQLRLFFVVWMRLAGLCGSKCSLLDAAVRYALLGQALQQVQVAVESDDNHPAVAALAIRLCADYGLRGQALGIASAFLEQMQVADEFQLDRPLPPSYAAFDARVPLVSLAKLLYQSVLEFVLDRRQHSLFFTPTAMRNFDEGFVNPEHSARFERTAVLCFARVDQRLSLKAGAKIFSATQDNQNAQIWRRLAAEGKLLTVSAPAERAADDLLNPVRAAKAKSSDDIQTLHQAAMSAFAAGETVVAERYWREAIALSPSFADAHHNFGLLLLQLGRAREAQVEFRKVVELLPQDPGALMNLAVAYKECGDFAAAEAAYGLGNQAATQMQAARRYAIEDLPMTSIRRTNLPLRPARTRLRIGYLSSDFYAHATMYLLRGVLRNHDKANFEIFAYSYTAIDDAMTAEVRSVCDSFRDIQMMSDDAAARLIADDGIDILVDLKGYTGGARLGICARRPAPLVVSWLGYPGSLGHETLADVIIGDATVT
ncbi:MAG: FkbM family methyltransferase, partial [Rhodocyclaceae bacterium]|nr:FkbM family methyltransferase [Rhodocyclaceae bacterium]